MIPSTKAFQAAPQLSGRMTWWGSDRLLFPVHLATVDCLLNGLFRFAIGIKNFGQVVAGHPEDIRSGIDTELAANTDILIHYWRAMTMTSSRRYRAVCGMLTYPVTHDVSS